MSLTPQAIAYQEAHIGEDRKGDIIAAAAICLFAASTATILRFVSRQLAKAALKLDDWLLVVGLFFTTATTADALSSLRFGLGKHFVLVVDPTSYAKNSIAEGVLYNPAIGCIKISILLLYRRIFPSHRFHLLLYAVGTVVLVFNTTAILVSIFQCLPIEANWNPTIQHRCINISLAYTIGGSINVALDAVILVLPLPQLWHLNISRIRMFQLIGIFLTGGLVTIFSIVRVTYLAKMDVEDVTWTEVDGFIWTVAEMCSAVVSACLPTLRPLVKWGKDNGYFFIKSGSKRLEGSETKNRKSSHIRLYPSKIKPSSITLKDWSDVSGRSTIRPGGEAKFARLEGHALRDTE